jgi:putative tricarboxylic transport membrane protein
MADTATMRRAHQITGALLLCFSIYVGVEALELRYYTSLGPGPGFFACWLALILGLLSIAMLAEATFGRPEPMPEDFFADLGGYLRMGAVVAALLVGALLLERIGFRLTMFGLYLFLLLTLGSQNIVVTLLIALAGSFGVYFVFTQWLNVPLPIGAFNF